MIFFEMDHVQLVGSKFCPFRRAIEILLHEHTIEFNIIDDDNQYEYPILIHEGHRLYGIIAIVEEMHFSDTDLSKQRMWLAIILGELWHKSARFILNDRILSLREYRHQNVDGMKQIRNRLSEFLQEINLWFKENHYFDTFFGYADAICASIISYLNSLDEIDWSNKKFVLEWYRKIQIRPSFKAVVLDKRNNKGKLSF